MRYYFAPWQERENFDGHRTKVPPSGARCTFDFNRNGMVLFEGPDVPNGGILLGNGMDGPANLNVVRNVLGEGLEVSQGDVESVLWDLLTKNGDPTGQNGWKPIQPTRRNGKMRIVTSEGRSGRQFRAEDMPGVVDAIRETYQEVRVRGRGPEFLDVIGRGLGLQPNQLTRPGQQPETPRRPGTVFTENFNTSNGPLDTANTQLDWSVHWSNAFRVVSNMAGFTAFPGTSGDPARANHNLGSDDHHVSAIVGRLSAAGGGGSSARFYGVSARHNTGGNGRRYYVVRWYENGDVGIFRELNIDSTDDVELVRQNITSSMITGHRVYVVVEGSTIEAWVDDQMVLSTTDSNITGNTLHGLVSYHNGGGQDDYIASDEFPVVGGRGRSQAIVIA